MLDYVAVELRHGAGAVQQRHYLTHEIKPSLQLVLSGQVAEDRAVPGGSLGVDGAALGGQTQRAQVVLLVQELPFLKGQAGTEPLQFPFPEQLRPRRSRCTGLDVDGLPDHQSAVPFEGQFLIGRGNCAGGDGLFGGQVCGPHLEAYPKPLGGQIARHACHERGCPTRPYASGE